MSSGNSGAGPNDATPTNRPSGNNVSTTQPPKGSSASGSPRDGARAKCSPCIKPPAPKSNAILRFVGPPIPTTRTTLDTSNRAGPNAGAGARPRETHRRPKAQAPLERSRIGCSLPPRAHNKEHRLERLEPYEGKLSRTVLRGVRAGQPACTYPITGVRLPRGVLGHLWAEAQGQCRAVLCRSERPAQMNGECARGTTRPTHTCA